ncbi:MAG TPA: four helix bundle protein [Pyrinomonadaceae bacterium]|nr:four helix bundle protein [Pyrinomonadaceae bacterium]
MGSQSYKDLMVWQKSIALCTAVYKLCDSFPRSELYGLSDQMKRAAVSVSSNIAEGQARQHVGEFLHFLSVANGSLAELDTQRTIAANLELIDSDTSNGLDYDIGEIRKMLYSLRARLKERN